MITKSSTRPEFELSICRPSVICVKRFRTTCLAVGADYVPLDTSMPFDKALVEYLSQRQARF